MMPGTIALGSLGGGVLSGFLLGRAVKPSPALYTGVLVGSMLLNGFAIKQPEIMGPIVFGMFTAPFTIGLCGSLATTQIRAIGYQRSLAYFQQAGKEITKKRW